MEHQNSIFKDRLFLWGVFATATSAFIFLASQKITEMHPDAGLNLFFINYLITILYTAGVFASALSQYRWKMSKSKIDYTILMLILWLISAFALNRNMNLFNESTDWLTALIIISCLVLVLGLSIKRFPPFFQHLIHILLGSAFMLFTYYAFYLVPFYIFSIPAALALGISLHTFVPLLLSIFTALLFLKNVRYNRSLVYSSILGILLCVSSISVFLVSWAKIDNRITTEINKNVLSDGKLSNWIAISQLIPKGFVGERLIKADLVYTTIEESDNWFWGQFSNSSFDEPMKHDPLVVLASLFLQKVKLSEKERIKILEAMYDSRHHAQERLWSGDKLQTINIISNVKIFPEFRLAYTEKILTIRNTMNRSWGSPQEAIYTFHLPEGSAVSSLSLWIGGKEEKGYLTTKSKADSAYKQIVGVEVKDPSVVHWQEGNSVSVRIFPCTASDDRKFKIGVSSQLHKSGESLIYENVYFDGPTAKQASETVQLSYSSNKNPGKPGKEWMEVKEGTYQLNRTYLPYWEHVLDAPPLSDDHFTFDSKSYRLQEYEAEYKNFSPNTICLDLNSSWSEEEFSELWPSIKNYPVYVFEDELVQLSETNKDAVFARLNKLNFSLFPFFKMADAENALIISKSGESSPNFSDLQDCDFGKSMKSFLEQRKDLQLYAIGEDLSPYLKSLKELRVFNYSGGSLNSLISLIDRKKFVKQQENDSTIFIQKAGILIQESDSIGNGAAPDHLLRLFAYNDILRKVAEGYFQNDYIKPDILSKAEKANVVSPVSSLIVLETQRDYDRFNIEQSKNSLKNASMKSSGAVPEPHEWLMIFIAAGVIIYLIKNPAASKRTI